MTLSNRLDGHSSGVFSRLAEKRRLLQARGVDVIDLSIGTPDLPPAEHVVEALREATLDPINYRYAITDRPELREAAARWYQRRFSVALNPDTQITSLLGSQDGLAHLHMAVIDPGDVVLVPDPGYPIFAMGPRLAGAQLYPMPQSRENDYIIDLKAIPEAIARRARLMVVSYPNNPVAVVAPESFYRDLVEFAHRYDVAVLYDNAYCELAFDGRVIGSFLSTPGAMDVGVEFNSLSKTYNLSGCRVGFALGNEQLISKLVAVKSHIDYGIFPALQIAAEEALNGPQDSVAVTRDTYQRRRDAFVGGLNALGWKVDLPQATMFAWVRLPEGYADAEQFAFDLMDKTGVIVVPGDSFGACGAGYVRIALVQDEAKLNEAVERIARSGLIAGDGLIASGGLSGRAGA